MSRPRAIAVAITLTASLAIAALLVATWPRPLPELAAAPDSGGAAPVVAGPVDVGADRPLRAALAAHPTDPRRLFLAFAHDTDAGPGNPGVAGYLTADGGTTWVAAFDRLPRPGEFLSGPNLAYGPDGELVFACNRSVNRFTPGPGGRAVPAPNAVTLDILASPDGGATWEERGPIDLHLSGPRLAFDRTAGPNRGRLYLAGSLGGRDSALYWSGDGGRGFAPATLRRPVETSGTGPAVVLPDGTVVAAFTEFARQVPSRLHLAAFTSSDGGASAGRAWLPAEFDHPRFQSNPGLGPDAPSLAADPATGRLVCLWADGETVDRRCILAATSPDGGRTWAGPTVVSEQTLGPSDPEWAVQSPVVAFNGRGILAAAWYDRRGLPPSTVAGAITTTGYNVRLRTSVDGGVTWGKSVRVNAAPGLGTWGDVRGGLALAAGADGRFHVAWLSDASGPMRLYTATVDAGGD